MDQNKDVILITSNLYRPHFGGVENSLFHLAKAYQKMGKMPVIVVSDISPDNSLLPQEESVDGVNIYRYSMTEPYYLGVLKLPKVLSGIANALKLYKALIKRYQPKLIISRYHFNQLFCKWAGGKNTVYLVPGVVKFQNASKHVSDYTYKEYVKWYYHLALQFLAFKNSDQLAVFSQNMVAQIQSVLIPKNTILITKPGVDTSRFFPIEQDKKYQLRKQFGLPCQSHVFLCVGRCVAAKGFDIAIKAFAQQIGTENQLWIIGDGEQFDNYRALALQLGLSDNVKFIGSTSTPEQYYQVADSFLMTSIYEPLGQTILEALSSGLPIIAFEPSVDVNTASREILVENCTTFVKKAEPSLLSDAIEMRISQSAEYLQNMSENARQHAEKYYCWDNLAEDLLKVVSHEN